MIVAITGASGIVYSVRLLEALPELGIESHLVVSNAGEMTRAYETELSAKELRGLADRAHAPGDIAASIASGLSRRWA
jgi:flavin prenyltransferase